MGDGEKVARSAVTPWIAIGILTLLGAFGFYEWLLFQRWEKLDKWGALGSALGPVAALASAGAVFAALWSVELQRRALAGQQPDLSINEKARILRMIRGLDPGDLALLDRLDKIDDPSFVPDPKKAADAASQLQAHLSRVRYMAAQEESIARDVLASAGCLDASFQDFGGPSAHVTKLGEQLLHVLAAYLDDHRTIRTEP